MMTSKRSTEITIELIASFLRKVNRGLHVSGNYQFDHDGSDSRQEIFRGVHAHFEHAAPWLIMQLNERGEISICGIRGELS